MNEFDGTVSWGTLNTVVNLHLANNRFSGDLDGLKQLMQTKEGMLSLSALQTWVSFSV